MQTRKIEGFEVTGISGRTTNENEMNPATAKIGPLWEAFFADVAPKLSEKSHVYGVYTNYETDWTGAFDVLVCSDTLQAGDFADSVKGKIEAGQYLVFTAKGKMPQIVIELWEEILKYFDSESCSHQRAYTTDFEYYKSENEVEIYIALK